MADRKISDLTALTTPASGDYLPIVDISEAAAASKNKRITIEELMRGVPDGTAAAPGIAFETDPNTGIYSPGADQLAVATNGTGRLFVDATGQVGIGVAAPAHLLQLNGPTATTLGLAIRPTGWNLSHRFSVPTSGDELVISSNYNGSTVDDATAGTSSSTFSTGLIKFATGAVNAAPTERLRITSAGLVGIGTSSPQQELHINDATGVSRIRFAGGAVGADNFDIGQSIPGVSNSGFSIYDVDATANRLVIDSAGNVGIGDTAPDSTLTIKAATSVVPLRVSGPSSEFARIDTSGRLLVGTSTSRESGIYGVGVGTQVAVRTQFAGLNWEEGSVSLSAYQNVGTVYPQLAINRSKSDTLNTFGVNTLSSGDIIGGITFSGDDGSKFVVGSTIRAEIDGGVSTNDMPTRLVFSTTADGAASPTERMRISANGIVSIGTTGSTLGATDGVIFGALESAFTVSTAGNVPLRIYNKDTAGTRYCMEFRSASAAVGSITHDGTNTSYTTSSDYRLKENVAAVTDGITRLQQLKPSRFNFISNPDKTVDGFIAHEAQAVVPECVTGEKDAIDDDGEPVYQGIDQAKLVPLLTAALQEAIAKIETLEARLTAAGIE